MNILIIEDDQKVAAFLTGEQDIFSNCNFNLTNNFN